MPAIRAVRAYGNDADIVRETVVREVADGAAYRFSGLAGGSTSSAGERMSHACDAEAVAPGAATVFEPVRVEQKAGAAREAALAGGGAVQVVVDAEG